jgi:hypothetical protein
MSRAAQDGSRGGWRSSARVWSHSITAPNSSRVLESASNSLGQSSMTRRAYTSVDAYPVLHAGVREDGHRASHGSSNAPPPVLSSMNQFRKRPSHRLP